MKRCFRQIHDREVWNEAVEQISPNSFFQSWQWGEVQELLKIPVRRFALYENNTIVGVAQITKISAKRGSFLHIRHGPCILRETETQWEDRMNYFLDFLRTQAVAENVWFFRMSPLIEKSPEIENYLKHKNCIPSAMHAMDAEYCWVLDLDIAEDQLLKNMRKSTRYEIKKSQSLDITIHSDLTKQNIDLFMDLYDKTAKRQGFVEHHGIEEEIAIFRKTNQISLYLAEYEGAILAGALILTFGGQAIYHHGASLLTKIPASYKIQWQAIRDAKNNGIKLYNFWGIAPKESVNHPWSGLTLFKQGFGGREQEYLHAQDYPISPLYSVTRCVELVRKKKKGYS